MIKAHHQGNYGFKSQLNRGSTFWVEVKRAYVKNPRTVLLIEDDQYQQKIYGHAFRKAGIKFLSASSLSKGIRIAQKAKPDLIVLDLLPGGSEPFADGIQTLKQIKKDKTISHIPVVIFTNYIKDEILEQALISDGEEIIIKTDVTPKEFVQMMKKKYL